MRFLCPHCLVKISRFRLRCKNWDSNSAISRKCECPYSWPLSHWPWLLSPADPHQHTSQWLMTTGWWLEPHIQHITLLWQSGGNVHCTTSMHEILRFWVPIHINAITALLWQKEASDIPSKFELLMFSYFIYCALLPGQILCINTHPAKRYVR